MVKMIAKIDEIEHDTDEMQVNLRKFVRKSEAVLNPVDVMFLYRTLEWVGDLADTALKVGQQCGAHQVKVVHRGDARWSVTVVPDAVVDSLVGMYKIYTGQFCIWSRHGGR